MSANPWLLVDREHDEAGLPEFHGHDWARDLDWQDMLVVALDADWVEVR